jgi:DNA-binding protein H-NS
MGVEMAKRGRRVSRKHTVKAAPKKAAAKKNAPASDLNKLLSSLAEMPIAALRRVMLECEKLLEAKAEGERMSFIEEVTARAAGMGMSIAELLKRAVPDSVMPSPPIARKKARAQRARPAVKFRDPVTKAEWSGRGRPARWITDYEKAGRKRGEFAV